MDHLIKVKTFRAAESAFDVYVNEDGRFFAYMGGDDPANSRPVGQDTVLAELERILGKRAKDAARVRIDYSVLIERSEGLVQGLVYGVHAGTGNPLVRWGDGDGRHEQLGSGSNPRTMRADMTAEAVARFNELVGIRHAAERELQELRHRHGRPYNDVVREIRALVEEGARARASA